MNLAFVALGAGSAGCTPDLPATEPAQTLALARAMATRGHRVRVYLPDDDKVADGAIPDADLGEGSTEHMPQLHRLSIGNRSARDAAELLAEGWSADRPDLVQAAGIHSALAAVAAEEAEGHGAPPLVADVRTITALTPTDGDRGLAADGRAKTAKLATALCRRADHVLTPSQWHARALRQRGVAGTRLSVLPFGLPGGMADGLAEYGGQRVTQRLLCPDGPAEACGAADVIAALRWVPDAELVVAGGPSPKALGRDRDARQLRALARRLRVADRVRVVGALPEAEMTALYRGVDIVVTVPRVPSAAGVECIEAMSHGCCVVAGWTGGARDAVLPGITGMLVPPADPRTLGRTLRDLLAAPARARSCGIAGADRARLRYGWGQLSTELERILGGLLESA